MMGLESEVESEAGSNGLMRYFAYTKKFKSPGMIQSLDWQSQPCRWKGMAYNIHLLSTFYSLYFHPVPTHIFFYQVIFKRIILFE